MNSGFMVEFSWGLGMVIFGFGFCEKDEIWLLCWMVFFFFRRYWLIGRVCVGLVLWVMKVVVLMEFLGIWKIWDYKGCEIWE
jgi:hypothetical protein